MVTKTKRVHKRFYTDNKVYIVHNDLIYPAKLVNCSEKGMYIISDVSFPLDTTLLVTIPLERERLSVTARVVWSVDKGDYEGVGVTLLNTSFKYTDFLINIYFGSVNFSPPSVTYS